MKNWQPARPQILRCSSVILVAVLASHVKPEFRESWRKGQFPEGVLDVVGYPKLVRFGLDYVDSESGTLRLAFGSSCHPGLQHEAITGGQTWNCAKLCTGSTQYGNTQGWDP